MISKLNLDLEKMPSRIEEKKAAIQQAKDSVEQGKKRLTAAQLGKKSKEMELSTQEDKIRKHEMELSSVKSNEAYKALLTEIEAAKNQKGQIEEDILNLMVEADDAVAAMKVEEAASKVQQQKLEGEIREIEAEIEKAKGVLEAGIKKRDAFAPQVPADVLSRYDYIRLKKKSLALAEILGETCGGCNTILTQDVLNQVKKGRDLVICESCARILYIPGALKTAAPVEAGAASASPTEPISS